MDFDMEKLGQSQRYKLLTALVIPRPIAWVSSLNVDGRVNLAPYSFFNVMGNQPPLVAFGPGFRPDGSAKDTPTNIARSGEFVINMVDRDLAGVMHQSAAPLAAGESEADLLGLKMTPSHSMNTPGVRDAKVRLECAHHQTLTIINNQVVFGIVRHMYVAEGVLDPDTLRVEPQAFLAVGRLQGPGWYSTSADQFDLGSFPREIKSNLEEKG